MALARLSSFTVLVASIVGVSCTPLAAAQDEPSASRSVVTRMTKYPLKLSADHRYLLDQANVPFLIVGDTPQDLMGRLTEAEADRYFADRQEHGFNTLGWVDITCAGRDSPENKDASTVDGLIPFLGYLPDGRDYEHYDLSKPNEAYFARLDHIVQLAAKHGLLIFLAPMETNGWLPTLRNNGTEAAHSFGQYLGHRYKSYANVAWLSGNDFVTWKNPTDDALEQAVARGIRSVAPDQLQTVELNYETSSSLDDPTWASIVDLNATYTYSPTYMQMLHSYNQRPILPTFLVEAHYDQENVGHPPDYGTPSTLRREEYWTMLSGGVGQFYGNFYTWSFSSGWEHSIDTWGVTQLTLWKNFFSSLPWQNLIPDQSHLLVTDGLGTFGELTTQVSNSDFCTAARTEDGTLAVAYLPTARTVTVNMSALSAPARAEWFDPTNGTYKAISPEVMPNRGVHQFTPPKRNHDGDSDWVLVLKADRALAAFSTSHSAAE